MKTIEDYRAIFQKQKAFVADLERQSKEAFAKGYEIEGTEKTRCQNERYRKIGMELKKRCIRESRKLIKIAQECMKI